MVLPNLIHPILVHIQQIDKGNTFQDENAREPVQLVQRTPTKIILGQPKWGAQKNVEPGKAGYVEGSSGYILFRKVDLDAESVTLEPQDRFIKIGHVVCDVYIIKLEWTGHYQDQNGPSLIKAHFADRQPSKQSKGK
jgi:hypothetical protein